MASALDRYEHTHPTPCCTEVPNAASTRKQFVSEVSGLRHAGEIKADIDLLFLALVILLCIAKIATN
jgi:hypothetical protein